MGIRDKVTDLVFKGRLTPQVMRRPPQQPPMQEGRGTAPAAPGLPGAPVRPGQRPAPRPAEPAIAAAAAAVSASGTAAQRRALEEAERAGGGAEGGGDGQPARRPKRQPIVAKQTVGRNEPCPCGSGKKYKQCCGKRA
jgi:hypothetical protein